MTKRRVSRVTVDVGTPERHQHDKVASRETDQAGVVGVQVMTSGHLNRYHATGLLGEGPIRESRRDAGRRLAEDYHHSGLQPNVISRMSDYVSGGSVQSFMPFKMDAYNRYIKARDTMPGGCWQVVHAVCCLDDPAGGEPRMEALRVGLDALARGYGIR